MLTPVRAASNASLSSHSQTAAIVASGLSQSVVAPAPVQAVEAADLNSAIAGKLNILLAAARERMFDALLDAINSASKGLPLPRQDGESNLAFAARLADAIQKLPVARINEIEVQLVNDGHTLPLRLIAEALKNPAGPEAARVIAYLETVRYKDRDLAARAVMRSYRQNDSSPMRPDVRPNILLQEESLLPLAKERLPIAQAPLPMAAAKQPAIPLQPAPVAAGAAEDLVELIDAVSEEGPTAPLEEVRAQPDTETEVLPEPFAESKQSALDVVAGHAPREAARTTHAEPAIPKVWTGVLTSITEEASEMIVAIIGEEQTAALLEDLATAPEAIETIIDETVAEDMARDDMPEMAAAAKSERAEALRLPAAADAAQLARPQRDIVAQPQILPASIVEAVQKSGLMKPLDGVAYAPHPYQFAKDGAEQRDGEMYRRDYEGGDSESEQQADSGAQHQQDEEAQPRPQGVAPQDLPEIASEPAGEKVGDPVYALYQRMVGWE